MIDKLMQIATTDECETLQTLIDAEMKTRTAYRSEPTAANKTHWDAAHVGLQQEIDRLAARYLHSSNVYENRNAVAQYLKEQGYKIGKTKLYEDAAKGMLRVQADGSILKSDVDLYIKAYLQGKKIGGDDDGDELARRKLEMEVKRLENQVREQNLEYEKSTGKLIERDQVELELASRAAIFSASFKALVNSSAADWVFLAGGQPEKIKDFRDAIHDAFDDMLNEYAQVKTFQVLFEDE